MTERILLVVTSADRMGGRKTPTGYWLEEVAAPYYAFADAGYTVDIASPKGGTPPRDPESDKPENLLEAAQRFDADAAATHALRHTIPLASIAAEHYATVFFAGGHGTMTDFPCDPHIIRLVETFLLAGKPVASMCHGPACLVGARDEKGKPIIAGKRFACFTNEEEHLIGAEYEVPFLLQTVLEQQGGIFSGTSAFSPCTVADGLLITGQNPASAAGTAHETLALLAKRVPHR